MSVKKPRKSPSTKRKTRIRLFWRYTTRSRVCAEDGDAAFIIFFMGKYYHIVLLLLVYIIDFILCVLSHCQYVSLEIITK